MTRHDNIHELFVPIDYWNINFPSRILSILRFGWLQQDEQTFGSLSQAT